MYIYPMHAHTLSHRKPAMESFKLSLLAILPFVLLAVVASETDGELNTFIVHVQPPANRVFGATDDRKTWYKSFLPDNGRLVHAYTNVVSGFAARLTRQELDVVSAMPGFLGAFPDRLYQLQTTHTPQFLGLNSQKGVWNSSASGNGVIIGVLDTGVFANHPSFSGDGMPPPPAKWKGRCDFNGSVCNNKLIGARTFLAGSNAMKGASTYDGPVPPTDENGHGTHTTSTAAGAVVPGAHVLGQARGVAVGMAPRAHIAVYKVCSEDCASSDILAGLDAAVADGADILSMSIAGPSVPFHEDSIAIGTFGAIEKGVFVSLGAGNAGPNVRSLANEAPWMLTVAASTMDRTIRSTVRLGNGLLFDGETVYQPEFSPATFYPVVYAGASGKPLAEFCGNGSLDGFDVKGKIVLCERGNGVGRIVKGAVVQSAGGVGMILMNQFPDGYSTIADSHVLPASHISYASGVAIKSYINSTANPVAQILFKGTVLGTSPAPAIISFSSRGPSLQNPGILKPDITGPGVSVLAAWPFQVGPPSAPVYPGPTFNIVSGTSMSTPHLSGIAALIKSAHPNWSPAAIKSAIMTTADITDRTGYPILNEQRVPANFFATGAGHVNPDKASNPGLVYDIATDDYIGFLCGLYTSAQVTVIARRPINCSAVTIIPERLLNYPSISVTLPLTWRPTVPILAGRMVKNVGEAPAVYYAEVDIPDNVVHVDVVPSRLLFTEANQEKSFTVFVYPKQGGTQVVQGELRWVSDKHTVRSPISVTFASY